MILFLSMIASSFPGVLSLKTNVSVPTAIAVAVDFGGVPASAFWLAGAVAGFAVAAPSFEPAGAADPEPAVCAAPAGGADGVQAVPVFAWRAGLFPPPSQGCLPPPPPDLL